MSPEELMDLAIGIASVGIDAGQSPFGCAIALDGNVISQSHNTVVATLDSSAHAEVNAIREGCKAADQFHLEGAIVATTCEPCPMCMSALHWARVARVYFGATIQDATNAGFNELHIPAQTIIELGGSKIELIGSVRADECKALFDRWSSEGDRICY